MVSIKLIAALAVAFAGCVSARDGQRMHRRVTSEMHYGYGQNDTIAAAMGTGTAGAMGTGTAGAVLTTTTYTTSTTTCVTATYTLGNGHEITTTITKMIEMPTAHESHYPTAPIDALPKATTVSHSLPPVSRKDPEGKTKSSTTTTLTVTRPVYDIDTKYQPEGPVAQPTAVPSVCPEQPLSIKTETITTTSTVVEHVTKTLDPAASIKPVENHSLCSPPQSPTVSGPAGCPAGKTTTITQQISTTVDGPVSMVTVYED